MKYFFIIVVIVAVGFGAYTTKSQGIEAEVSNDSQNDSIVKKVEVVKVPRKKTLQEEFGVDTIKRKNDTYQKTLLEVKNKKEALAIAFQKGEVTLDSVGRAFTEMMVNNVFPYWYGTPWDFNGYTNVPNEGVIACGYFVSTTLKHAGMNLNRYRLAQQAALTAAKSLCVDEKIHIYTKANRTEFDSIVKNEFKDGLYMLGLSSHVGFILKQKGEVFFIQSNYVAPVEVICRKVLNTEVMLHTDYYLAPLSTNKTLMKKWLQHSAITVLTK